MADVLACRPLAALARRKSSVNQGGYSISNLGRTAINLRGQTVTSLEDCLEGDCHCCILSLTCLGSSLPPARFPRIRIDCKNGSMLIALGLE